MSVFHLVQNATYSGIYCTIVLSEAQLIVCPITLSLESTTVLSEAQLIVCPIILPQ